MNLPGKLAGDHPLVTWLNKLRDFAAGCRVMSVHGGRFAQGANGTQIWVTSSPAGGAGAAGEAAALTPCTFVSMDTDTVTARPIGVTTSDYDFAVAKPPKLRFSITSVTIDSTGITYSGYATVGQTRVAYAGGTSENQVIVPRYVQGDILFYITCSSNGTAAPKQDINVDARAWAKVYA